MPMATVMIKKHNHNLLVLLSCLALVGLCFWQWSPEEFHNRQMHRRQLLFLRGFGETAEHKEIVPSLYSSLSPQYNSISSSSSSSSYSLQNVLQSVPYWRESFGILVYDPLTDKFILNYPRSYPWKASCGKLINAFVHVSQSLRTLFPERFTPNQDEFVMAISGADMEGIRWTECLREEREDCVNDAGGGYIADLDLAPTLHFGSIFQKKLIPNVIAMPMAVGHVNCFDYWAQTGIVCERYLPRSDDNPKGLIFPEHVPITNFKYLIPQVIWRGTDFTFVKEMRMSLKRPSFTSTVVPAINKARELGRGLQKKQAVAIEVLREHYAEYVPRWQGVIWTAEAELEAQEQQDKEIEVPRMAYMKEVRAVRRREQEYMNREEEEDLKEEVLPWCNIKFSESYLRGKGKVNALEVKSIRQFNNAGIPVAGEHVSLEELSLYKYHIDLGGGGGTTWTGTLQKLALPGVLFHHVTPTKDFFHDLLEPWVHYIPIKEDISDLKEKMEWAEAHPEEAQRISEHATAFVRWWGTPEGMQEMFNKFYGGILHQVVDAYQPLRKSSLLFTIAKEDWRTSMASMIKLGEDELVPVLSCGARHSPYSQVDCDKSPGQVAQKLLKTWIAKEQS